MKLPSKADTILFSSKLHSKASSPIYLVLYYLYKFFYESISNNIQPAWSCLTAKCGSKGTFSFPVCAFNTGTAELWGWVGCSPTKNNLLLSLLFILIFLLKNLTNFSEDWNAFPVISEAPDFKIFRGSIPQATLSAVFLYCERSIEKQKKGGSPRREGPRTLIDKLVPMSSHYVGTTIAPPIQNMLHGPCFISTFI